MSLFIPRLLVLLMPFAPALMMAEESAADDATPTPLAELLEQLPKVAAAGRGMDANEEALAHAFARHGRAAADPLVALLKSEDPEIYQLVTYCLVALKKGDFEPRHLEPMAKAARKADFLIEAAVTEARTTGKLHKFSTLATEVGQAGKHLAERLIALLDDPDPNVRLAACRTLGYLGDLNAWPHLCRMLKAEDWRIAYSAALSLTQLKAVASRPSLKFCRDHYWYPRVRYAADFALRRLAEVDATKADQDRLGPTVNAKNLESAFGTFDFHDGQLRPLDDLASIPGLTLPAKDAEMKDSLYFARQQDPEIAKRDDMQGTPDLTLPREQELAQARQSVYAGIPSLQTNHPPLYQAIVQGAPEAIKDWKNVGLFGPRVIAIEHEADTTFVAIAAGEWYGGLFVIEPGQNARWIFKDFLKTLLRWNGHLITLSGMSHMGMDYGTVHRVVRDGTKWKTEFLYALPGCPQFGSVLADGRLFANCGGGAVAISPNGKFEFLGSGQIQEPDAQLPESPK